MSEIDELFRNGGNIQRLMELPDSIFGPAPVAPESRSLLQELGRFNAAKRKFNAAHDEQREVVFDLWKNRAQGRR